MNLHPVNRLNLKDVMRSPSYLSMAIIVLLVPLQSVIQISYGKSDSAGFTVAYTLLTLNLSVYFLLNMLTVGLIVISEKSTGRCEYYLANKLDVHRLTSIYSLSSHLLCIGPIVFLNILIMGYASIMKQEILQEVYFSTAFVYFAITFLLFTRSVTSVMTLVSMLSTTPERIRTALSVGSVLFVFGATLTGTLINKLGWVPGHSSITWTIGSSLLLLTILCAVVQHMLKKRLSNETVILALRQ
ncbi:hypothetical protein R70723_20180 [Paenibacillus sp. FSL R7-0273]|uniref:hypothetical protein n=1 Tax=Paenibacillus sp. FSL R7-0273 TaxID=1536772 RepID=UPI0004F6D9B1|nr:hypothetical protein [Paenibacillus sp. FSL R7-0273]AIQ47964.1 hypothetical protein R70723_20180 [Paenibacillus sp. FSL R7-0273]OMF94484.1 hypothetical protein BK144_08115 [Paenibacillus sp. FSL R7-0273]